MIWNLSIHCVNDWTYGFICDDKTKLLEFLRQYDHEGSTISLVCKEGSVFTELYNEDVYKELGA